MASFEPRGAGVRAIVRVPGEGKRTQTFDTQAEAEAWAAALERKKTLGLLSGAAATKVTCGEAWEAYETAVGSKLDSARWNRLRIGKWLLDPLAARPIATTTTHEINEWIERRLVDVSPATVNRELNLMSAAFTYAVKTRKWIAVNPCYGAHRPERGRARNRPLLSADEFARINRCTGYDSDPELVTLTARVGACFLLAVETAMRSGEILRLKPKDYLRDLRTVQVTATERGGRKGARSGRGKSSGRSVPLTGRAIELLDQLLLRVPPDQPYIVGVDDVQRDALWRKARDQACVEDLTFHDTKHEAATRMSRFLDVLALSHAIGTKDLRLLRDTYYNNDASRTAALLPDRLAP
jgi:integrase